MQVVADELVRLARTTLDASTTLARSWSGTYADLNPPATAAGDTGAGPSLVAAVARAAEAADLAVGRLVGVLQEDADDVLKVAFDVSATDDDVARRLAGGTELRRTGAA
jgi:hypothetical protein